MKSFQSLLFVLLGLLSFAFAEEIKYDTTVYLTNTVTQVYTITKSGTPTGVVANVTSTFAPSVGTHVPYGSANITGSPSVTTGAPAPTFTGAASQLNVNAFAAILALGLGYLAL